MKKNLLWIFLVVLLPLKSLFSQEGLPFYNHYLISDKYLINPSYAGVNPEVFTVRGTYRNQWDNLEDSPNTQTLSGHATVVDRLAVGAYVFNDQNGLTSLRGANLSAAYHIPLGDRYDSSGEPNRFSFGLSYNFFQQTFDLNRIRVVDPNDPLLQEDTYWLHYFNLGASFQYKSFYAGISVLDIPLIDNVPITNAIEPLPTWFYFLAGYKIRAADGIVVEPSLVMNINSNSERHLDANVMAHFGYDEYNQGQGISFGISYRQDLDVNGTQALSVSPLLKVGVGQLRAGVAYDIGLSDISDQAGNGLLFSIGWDFANPFNPDFR